ncbi:MAG: hypothetical protein PHS31_03085 [Victivallaceae bacterium]|nr:hypothetical protein [Victivallaceae bacterium]MDD4181290.1 hypothetical protein [Victivallaceae bacterium]
MLKYRKYSSAKRLSHQYLESGNCTDVKKIKALYLLGLTFILERNDKKAKKFFEQTLQLDDMSYKAFFCLGILNLKEHNIKQGAMLFSKTLELYKNSDSEKDYSYYRDFEEQIILFYKMMCSFALDKDIKALMICNELQQSDTTQSSIIFWCNLLCLNLNAPIQKKFDFANDKDIMLRSVWKDSIVYYFPIKPPAELLGNRKYSKEIIINAWLNGNLIRK